MVKALVHLHGDTFAGSERTSCGLYVWTGRGQRQMTDFRSEATCIGCLDHARPQPRRRPPTMSDDNAELIAEATGVAAFQGYGGAKGIEVFKKMMVALAAAQPSPDYNEGHKAGQLFAATEHDAAEPDCEFFEKPSPVQGADDERALIEEIGAHVASEYDDDPHLDSMIARLRASRRSPSVADLTAKADAWDEGWEGHKEALRTQYHTSPAVANPYRTTVTGEDKA